jgi:hypothetical protein
MKGAPKYINGMKNMNKIEKIGDKNNFFKQQWELLLDVT